MAIALAAFAVALRYFAPHHVFPQYQDYPVVPAITVLMLLGVALEVVRRRTRLGFPAMMVVQWVLLVWAVISLTLHEGLGGAADVATSDYLKDLMFVSIVVVAVDRLGRFKILVGSVVGVLLLISAFGLPQIAGERRCGEWQEGDMANLVMSEYRCQHVSECFKYEKKIPRAYPGIGSRNWRCERVGPFDIAAYIGRMRWTGVFDDSNNLGGAIAMMIPLLMGWFWGHRRRVVRLAWPLAVVSFLAAIVGTGSRGAQVAFVGGAGITLWGLWGRKAVYVGVAAVIAVVVAALVFGKLMVREEDRFEGSTDVSDRFRRDAMHAGYRLWRTNPVFGVGHTRFEDYHVIDPHNAFLAAAGELGTVGLLLYGLGLWLMFKSMWVVFRRSRELGLRHLERLALGVLGADVAGVLSLAMFLSTYDKLSWLVPLTFNTGLLRAARQQIPDLGPRVSYRDVVWSAPLTLLVVGIIYVGLMTSYTLG